LFYCGAHGAEAQRIADAARDSFSGALTVGAPAESIIGGRVELERGPGVSVLAARLDGARAEAFEASELFPVDTTPAGVQRMGELIGADAEDHRATFLFADPFTLPMITVLPALNRALALRRMGEGEGGAGGLLFGGVASGAGRSGENRFIIDGRVVTAGGVGVTLSGPVRIDTVVSQGCRPLGPNMVITGARNNLIMSLGG